MLIQGNFDIEVDPEEFREYAFRFNNDLNGYNYSDEKIAENFIVSLLLGMYRGGTADSAGVTVTKIKR